MVDNYRKRDLTYRAYSDFLFNELNKSINSFIVGKSPSKVLGAWNMFFLIMQLRNESYTSVQVTDEQMDCFTKKALCLGIDLTLMKQIWPTSYIITKKGIIPADDDGIGFMQIEGDGEDHPIFRINKI